MVHYQSFCYSVSLLSDGSRYVIMGTSAKTPQGEGLQTPLQNPDEFKSATVRWAIGVFALFLMCMLVGGALQRSMQSKKEIERARMVNKCISDPAFNRELCATLVRDEDEASLRIPTLRRKGHGHPVFQLSGSDDDLTPRPGL